MQHHECSRHARTASVRRPGARVCALYVRLRRPIVGLDRAPASGVGRCRRRLSMRTAAIMKKMTMTIAPIHADVVSATTTVATIPISHHIGHAPLITLLAAAKPGIGCRPLRMLASSSAPQGRVEYQRRGVVALLNLRRSARPAARSGARNAALPPSATSLPGSRRRAARSSCSQQVAVPGTRSGGHALHRIRQGFRLLTLAAHQATSAIVKMVPVNMHLAALVF
jgi:hypothetical protein